MKLSPEEIKINKRIGQICGIPLRVKRWKYSYFNGAITSSGHFSEEAAIADSQHMKAGFLRLASPNDGVSDPVEYETDNHEFSNYCGDLNAIQEVVLTLKANKLNEYIGCLAGMIKKDEFYALADAPTRSKAFVEIHKDNR